MRKPEMFYRMAHAWHPMPRVMSGDRLYGILLFERGLVVCESELTECTTAKISAKLEGASLGFRCQVYHNFQICDNPAHQEENELCRRLQVKGMALVQKMAEYNQKFQEQLYMNSMGNFTIVHK